MVSSSSYRDEDKPETHFIGEFTVESKPSKEAIKQTRSMLITPTHQERQANQPEYNGFRLLPMSKDETSEFDGGVFVMRRKNENILIPILLAQDYKYEFNGSQFNVSRHYANR